MPANIEIEILHDVPADIEVLLENGGTEVSVEIGQDPVPALELEFANIGPQGMPGEGTATTNPAGQDSSSGRVVYIDNGEAKYFDPSNQSLAGKAIGITKNAALSGDSLNIISAGVCLVSGWGLTPGTVYYAGPNGTLVTDVTGLAVVQKVGTAISANELVINFSSPIISI